MLVAKGRPAVLRVEVRNFDGILTAPTGSVSVVVKDVDDATVASGNASATATTGVYSYTLPTAVTGELGAYVAVSSCTVSGSTLTRTYEIDVVGDYLFEINELRDRDSSITEVSYPAEMVRDVREKVTQDLETAAQVAFSKRVKRAILNGDGSSSLLLPDVEVSEVLAVVVYGEDAGVDVGDDVTGTDLTDVEVDRTTGLMTRTDGQVFPAGSNNILVDYECGYDTVPGPIRAAALTLAIEYLVPSSMPARATSQSTDIGDFRISVANIDLGRETGIPAVDAAIQRYGRTRPRLG